MTDYNAAVVRPYYAEEAAYRRGYSAFQDADHASPEAISHFKESARWANTVAPQLRAAAGMADGGHGTYQIDREVAAIKPGCEEDRPAAARITTAARLYDEIVIEAFDRGAHDAMNGLDADPDRDSPLR